MLRIDYPDGGSVCLPGASGRASPGDPQVCGYVGLQNVMCYHLRKVRPTRVIVPTPTDLHPDHQITYNELMISLFHASGPIWPELGKPLRHGPAGVRDGGVL